MSPERFARIHASFERHEFWTLMFPAMLPPPTPFKMFVLAASAFQMRLPHFLAAVFAGRFVRFLVLAVLTIKFGPQFVQFVTDSLHERSGWLWLVVILAVVTAIILWWKKKRQAPRERGVANRINPHQ
jgi:membrane protein DedA with SNARE-associated domain